MAVYERAYKGYAGHLTPEHSRLLVLSRHALQSIFRSKLFLLFFVGCFTPSLAFLTIIYLSHNLKILELLGMTPSDLALIDAAFFMNFLAFQTLFLGFVMVLIVGPVLISSDRAHNALPLYLSRPLNRTEYVAGKLLVLAVLLSAISWAPNLLLFFVQSYLAGGSWLAENFRIAVAIFVGSWVWILVVSLVALAASAVSKRRMLARILLAGVVIILMAIGGFLYGAMGIRWGQNLNLFQVNHIVWTWLFERPTDVSWPPLWSAWASLAAAAGLAVLVLARKVRAYEVVR